MMLGMPTCKSATLILCLFGSQIFSSAAGAEIDYGRIKGEALKEVLKPVPAKEPAEALRCLETIEGFNVEFVAHEPLVLDPAAAAIDENGWMYVAEDADYPYRPKEGEPAKAAVK